MNERLFENLRIWKPGEDETEGRYGIPKMEGGELPEEIEMWTPFNNLQKKLSRVDGVQMYVDDYRINRLWATPKKYVDGLRRAGAVLTPDYSIYVDVPEALGIYNHYRKHWIGAYWQQCGINVIPSICWGDEKTYEWCFDGEPHRAAVSVSSVGTQRNAETKKAFLRGYDAMLERLEPSVILFFGGVPREARGNIVREEAYYEKFDKMRKEAKER